MTNTARSHRHHLPVARALGWAGIAVLLAAIGLAGTARAQTPAPEPGPDPSGCVLIDKAWVGRQFAPNFLVGDTIDVTATVKALCPAQSRPVHIVLVLDGSSTMAGEPNAALRKAAREFIDRLDLKDRPATQIGVVAFNGEATVLCQLTNRASQASLCVGRVGASGGGSNIAAGIYSGEDVLRRGRLRFEDPTVIREVMIVVTDGANSEGCPPVLAAADAVKAEGILLMTVCVTDACDADCISRAATAPNYHYVAGNIAQLNAVVASISFGLNVLLRTLTVDHVIAPGFEIVPGSIAPTPAVAEAGRIGWSRTDVTPDGVTMTYRLRAVAPGRHLPIWRSNTIDFTDLLGAAGRTETRTPVVDVFDPASPAPPEPDDLLLAERSLAIAPATAEIGDRLAAQLRLATPTTATVPAYVNIVLRVPPHLRIESATERFAIPGDSDGRRVSWWVDTADAWPIAFTATLRAVAAGEGGAAAIGYGPDGEGFKDVVFTAMSGPVRVTAPPGLPSPTAPSPRRRTRIFLPLAVSEACAPSPPTDAVIVADTSTSMVERLPDGATKQDAAARAVGAMIDRMDVRDDRFALVTFDRTAAVRVGFTTEPGDVVRALREAPLADGTAIDTGLLAAAALLGGLTRRPEARGVVVLITDGRSYPATPAAAVAAAAAAKAAGATVFAIGLGNEVDRATLGEVASSLGHARFTGSTAEVRAAFEGVAALLRCVRTAYWGGRTQ